MLKFPKIKSRRFNYLRSNCLKNLIGLQHLRTVLRRFAEKVLWHKL